MAASGVTIRHTAVIGGMRIVFGDFTNATDADGVIDTTLSTVLNFQVMGRGDEDRDCAIWRNSGDAATEYDYTPTIAHTGGRVSYTGLASTNGFYRFNAYGY
jgi:hypothetical protein